MKFVLLFSITCLLSGCLAGASAQIGNGPIYSVGDARAIPGNPASELPDIRPRVINVPRYVYLRPGERFVPNRSHWIPRRNVRCRDGSTPIVYRYNDPRAGINETRIRCD